MASSFLLAAFYTAQNEPNTYAGRISFTLTETSPGATAQRPALRRGLKALEAGDILVVWKLDRLARSTRDPITMLDDLKARGVQFKSITEAIETETPLGREMWQMIGVMAEFERSLISERTRAGVLEAKGQGVKFERKQS